MSMLALMSSTMAPRAETEGLVIHQRLVDIGEAAERVEVVLLVVVQRRLLPESGERRVRVGVDLYVVGIEVDSLRGSAFQH